MIKGAYGKTTKGLGGRAIADRSQLTGFDVNYKTGIANKARMRADSLELEFRSKAIVFPKKASRQRVTVADA